MTTSSESVAMPTAAKIRFASVWLDGCSGCHMSLLDMDERLIELAPRLDVVYGPLVDTKVVPTRIDLALVEGAVSNEHDLAIVRELRRNAHLLVSLGDCAVTGNVPSMRNAFSTAEVYDRAYVETVTTSGLRPSDGVPALLEYVQPVHTIVDVDLYLPGCPPPSNAIYFVLSELVAGRVPDTTSLSRFGA